MAAKIKDQFNVDTELIGGDNGVFDVVVDGKLIFSKHDEDRFPENAEILDQLKS